MHSRIAHTRLLKDNARIVWKQVEQENNPLPMKLEQLPRTIAISEYHSITPVAAVMIRDNYE
jgi:hypothetical protein